MSANPIGAAIDAILIERNDSGRWVTRSAECRTAHARRERASCAIGQCRSTFLAHGSPKAGIELVKKHLKIYRLDTTPA
jgi:hypothetical protein